MHKIATLLLLAACTLPVQAQNPHVWLDTDQGPIIVELDEAAAPVTVDNFLRYIDDGFYDGLIFHRVAEGFVIQGGGFDTNRQLREPTYDQIVNEANNGLNNTRGTIAMARTDDPDSAASQFFINLDDNDFLDPGGNTDAGYTVFGEVVLGMANVDAIASLATIDATNALDQRLANLQNFPYNTPVIERAVRTDGFPLMADHSGSWFEADNAGVGFNVEFANNAAGEGPIAIAYWYNFDEQRQFWLTGQVGFEWGASEVTMDLFSHRGDEEGVGFENPPDSDFSSRGTLTLRFDGCASGTFSYDMPDFGSGEIQVARLSRPESFRCVGE